jgi:hypothetical protein
MQMRRSFSYKSFLFSTFLFLVGLIMMPISVSHAQTEENVDISPPHQLDISDPFAQDLKRSTDRITGGITIDGTGYAVEEHSGIGRELLGKSSQTALHSTSFRVVGVSVRSLSHQRHIPETSKTIPKPGLRAIKTYLRLGEYDKPAQAKQHALNLMSAYGDYLDVGFIIRVDNTNEMAAQLDLGPFANPLHADRFCALLIHISHGLVNDCFTVEEYPAYGAENIYSSDVDNSFSSKALMRLSADAVSQQIADDTLFDLNAAVNQTLILSEGQIIGTGSAMITKVTENGVILVDDIGQITFLPFLFLPEESLPDPEPLLDAAALSGIDFGENHDDEGISETSDAPNLAEQLLELE